MNDLGITPRRDAMFKQFSKEILDLKNKINDIYVISEKLYTLALARKALGLEDRAKELLAAQFVVRRQTALLESKLGTSSLLYTYESDSMRDVQKKADEILEVILETYGDLLNDVKTAGTGKNDAEESNKVANNSSSKLDSDPGNEEISFDDFNASSDLLNMLGDL